jgi:hypothetical protein
MTAPRSSERKLTMARLTTSRVAAAVGLAVLMVAPLATVVQAAHRSPWAVAVNAEPVPWSAPVNLGANLTSAAAETRASFANHGRTLYFGSARSGSEGSTDVYGTNREQEHDPDAAATDPAPVCRRGWPAFGAGTGCDMAATDRPVAHAQLEPNTTLAREHHAYPASTGQKSTNTQPTEPNEASPLLAAVGLVRLTILLAAAFAFLWLRDRARARQVS